MIKMLDYFYQWVIYFLNNYRRCVIINRDDCVNEYRGARDSLPAESRAGFRDRVLHRTQMGMGWDEVLSIIILAFSEVAEELGDAHERCPHDQR